MNEEEIQPESQPAEKNEGALSKAERKQLRRAQKMLEQEKAGKRSVVKRALTQVLLWGLVLAFVGWFIWSVVKSPKLPADNVVSRTEIHWHTHVVIKIKGKEITIPANVGINTGETHPERMHTHDTDNKIHIEKLPPVTKDDIKLSNFFQIWGKTLTPDCVLDSCNVDKGTLKMTVNGKENHDFGDYLIHNNDEIVLDYE